MAIRYTKVTRKILHFIEENGFITIGITARLYYKGHKNGYDQARAKLALLYKNGVLKRYKSLTGEYIYQFSIKKVSDHRKYILDCYSRIYEYADEVLFFKREVAWITDKYRNDGHIVYSKDGILGAFLIEFEKFSKTSIEKIDTIEDSKEVQAWYLEHFEEEYFPKILLITETGCSQCKNKNGKWKSVVTDYTFSNLEGLL